jgi:hypothetical protein
MAYTDREDLNYLGELFLVGAFHTPFLNMIGGLSGNRAKKTKSFIFPVAQPWTLSSASQPAITEADSVTGQTAGTITRGQDTNTVQIFQKAVEVSYAKQSTHGEISGLASIDTVGGQPVNNEKAFQKMAALRQVALDADYSMLNGAYQAASDATTAAKMRGIITACSSNSVNASSAALSKAMINQLLRTMAGNGAVFENMVMFVNAFQKQAVTELYGYAPENRNVGGMNIAQIETDFCKLGVIWAPNVPAASLLIADMNYCYPVFCEVPGKGLLFYEDKAKAGASEGGQIYGQIGLDYGPEEFHGKIYGLATS